MFHSPEYVTLLMLSANIILVNCFPSPVKNHFWLLPLSHHSKAVWMFSIKYPGGCSLVAQCKQTQQAFGLAYRCPGGIYLRAKMKICIFDSPERIPPTCQMFLQHCISAVLFSSPVPLLAWVLCFWGLERNKWLIGGEALCLDLSN